MTPIIQAIFFCAAPTYSGFCLLTISLPITRVGEYLGLTKTLITKSVKNNVITYLIGTKFSLNTMNINDKKVAKNRIPAAALISLSFNTGMK